MLPDCCYGLGGPWVQSQSNINTSRLGPQASAPVPSSSLSQILQMYSTPQKHVSSLESGSRSFQGHGNHFYPEIVYSVAEKPREPLNEVRA